MPGFPPPSFHHSLPKVGAVGYSRVALFGTHSPAYVCLLQLVGGAVPRERSIYDENANPIHTAAEKTVKHSFHYLIRDQYITI